MTLAGTHSVPVPLVAMAEVVTDWVVLAAAMVNWGDWARIVLRSVSSLTRLTWKPAPDFQPPLGGFTVVLPRLLSTRAARI